MTADAAGARVVADPEAFADDPAAALAGVERACAAAGKGVTVVLAGDTSTTTTAGLRRFVEAYVGVLGADSRIRAWEIDAPAEVTDAMQAWARRLRPRAPVKGRADATAKIEP